MRVHRIVWVGILCLAAPLFAAAQTIQGSISGTVVDSQGAVVPQATVTAVNTDQTTSTSTTTDDAGNFVFAQLAPANYAVIVEAKGFKKLERRDVILNANTSISVGRLTLPVGGVEETVEVVAQGAHLQTETAERGYSLVGEQLKNIEVNGRSYLGLLRLVPGTYTDRQFDLNTNEIGNIYSNGSRGNQQNLTLNGVSNTDYGANGRMMVTVSLDSVQEVKVLTSNYEAQYGKNAGAQISVVTKAGTQELHGSGYTYYRDKGMNANSWINNRDGLQKPLYHYNYYGYTVGGPVYVPGLFNIAKDKLFFFWSEEYQRQQTPRDQNSNTLFRTTVPTALERQGDFSQSVNSSGQLFNLIRDPLSGQPCTASNTSGCFQDGGVLGRMPANRLYAPGIALLNLFPLPNTAGANGYNYLYQPSGQVPRHEQVLRIDYNASPKLRLYGSWIHLPQDVVSINASASGYSLSPNFPITPVDFDHPGYLFNLNATSILTTHLTNEAQFGVSHHPVTVLPHNADALTKAVTGVNLPTVYGPLAGWIPDFTFGGSRISNSPQLRYNGAGGAYTPFYSKNTIFEAIDNLTYLQGKHLFKTGVYVHVNHKDQNAFAPTEGGYNWGDSSNNPLDTGFGFANATIGVYTQFTQASRPANGEYRYTNLEFYGQDTWKVNSRLTLIYGVRAAWFQPWFDKNLQTSTFVPSNWDPNQAPSLFWPGIVNGALVALVGSPTGPVAIDPATGRPYDRPQVLWGNIVPNSGNATDGILQAGHGVNRYMMQSPGLLFGPRLGVTYDITGRGNLIFRTGAGKYFDRYQGNEIFNTITNPPAIFVPSFFNGFAQNINSSAAFLGPSGLTVLDPRGRFPTYYKYSAGIQMTLPWAMILDAGYVGSLGRNLLGNRNLNAVPYGADFLPQNQDPTKVAANPNALLGSNASNANFLRPYPGYGSITLEEFANDSSYNALQVTLDRRFAKGLFLGVAYTWSKCLDEGSNDGASRRIDNLNHVANYGPCDFDIRHNLVFNYVYALPGASSFGRFNTRVTRAVFDGWQLSGTTQFRTGLPYSVSFNVPGYSGQNYTGTPDFGPRVMVIGDPYGGTTSSPYNRLSPTAFAPASVGSIGIESGRNYLTGPGVNNWDLSLQKTVGVTSHAHMEFRVDAFNVFNHTQFSGVNNTISFSSLTNPTVTNRAINPTTGAINKGGFGAVNGVRPPRILQLVARFVF
jgi:hypothetical protein